MYFRIEAFAARDRRRFQPEVVLGILVQLDDAGAPLVDWPGNPGTEPVPALCTAHYTAADALAELRHCSSLAATQRGH